MRGTPKFIRSVCTRDGVLTPDEVARHGSFPFLPNLVAEVAALQYARSEARGRSYQLDIVRRGAFLATSPRTGVPIPSGDSIILPDRTTFYRFPDCPDLLLGAANLSKGYALVAVVLVPERLLIQIGDPTWGVEEHHVHAAEAILSEPRWWPAVRARTVHVFTGDTNFAHHSWNQLAALETLLSEPHPWVETVPVSATFQPLGPLQELFPERLDGPVPWESSVIPGAHNGPGIVHVNAGGFQLTNSIRERIRVLAAHRCGERLRQAQALARQHAPVVWVSVRTRNRTPTNQRDLILALCRRLFATFERCAVILDGHSLPFDLDTNPNYDRADMLARVDGDRAEIAAISASLRAIGLPRVTQALVPACGFGMLDSVLLAHAADFSLCHHGSVQHKIGWLAGKPGVVHSNRRTLDLNPAPWVAGQCEESPLPVYVPPGLITDVDQETSTDEEIRSRLFENYRIGDVEATVDLVVSELRRTLPERAGFEANARGQSGGFGARLFRRLRSLRWRI